MKRRLLCTVLATAALLGAASAPMTARAFSGEDPLAEFDDADNWYHAMITREAANAAEFESAPLETIAWHADYIDSYLYNPFWWALDPRGRVRAVLATRDELAKLHFDDLNSRASVNSVFRRYVTGTMAGLLWAADQGDIGAAHHLLGISLHALQDFYSHSNWVDDPARRATTLFDTSLSARSRMDLYTGFYELDEHLGRAAHGKIAPVCTAVNVVPAARWAMALACTAVSPLSNGELCREWRACDTSDHGARPLEARGVDLPDFIPHDLLVFHPPGIALDSYWMAEIGAQLRPTPDDATGAVLFDTAYDLAVEASTQWLEVLGDEMERQGHGDFWRRVKNETSDRRPEDEFEHFDRFVHQFLSVGDYPSQVMEQEFFLRVEIDTSNNRKAGTNADIQLLADGQVFDLDYLPDANAILDYNDFERGDRTVYTVGPLSSVPDFIELRNRAPDARDTMVALGNRFIDSVKRAARAFRDLFRAIIGYDADEVGEDYATLSWDYLRRVGRTPRPLSFEIDGKDEGRYRIEGSIRRTATYTRDGRRSGRYHVTLDRLVCVTESTWDRGSKQDEPFVIATLASVPGVTNSAVLGPFHGVDTGESRALDGSWILDLPDDVGAAVLAVRVFESDSESAADRERLRALMAGEIDEEASDERDGFITTFGNAVRPDWLVENLRIYAFSRGDTVSYGRVFNGSSINRWIQANQRARFYLDRGAVRDAVTDVAYLERKGYRPLPPIKPPVSIPVPLPRPRLPSVPRF